MTTDSVSEEATVMVYWTVGAFNTAEIGQMFDLPESKIYSIVNDELDRRHGDVTFNSIKGTHRPSVFPTKEKR
jgi:hypothetical protein